MILLLGLCVCVCIRICIFIRYCIGCVGVGGFSRPNHLNPLNNQTQHDKIEQKDQDIQQKESKNRNWGLPDEIDEESSMEIATGVFAGLGANEESMEDHTEEVAGNYRADIGLVARRIEGGCFGGEEDELDDGADGEEDDGAAVQSLVN